MNDKIKNLYEQMIILMSLVYDKSELFEKSMEGLQDLEKARAMLASMRSFENDGYDCRMVFWFDN